MFLWFFLVSYILLGEFVGFFGGVNILMEYVLLNVVVVSSFMDYLVLMFGVMECNVWSIVVDGIVDGYNELDVLVVVFIFFMIVCLCYS